MIHVKISKGVPATTTWQLDLELEFLILWFHGFVGLGFQRPVIEQLGQPLGAQPKSLKITGQLRWEHLKTSHQYWKCIHRMIQICIGFVINVQFLP